MTKDEEDFKLLKIQTFSLRVNIHCEGCNKKVKKLLQRIEGVCHVKIEAEHQKVTVSGSVDSTTLINKLIKAGKHGELWSQNQNTNHQPHKPKANDVIKNPSPKGQKQGLTKTSLESSKPKTNPKGSTVAPRDEEGGEVEEEEVLQPPKPVNQQQQTKKTGGGVPHKPVNGNNGVNASKKVNQKQNITATKIKNAVKTCSNVESNGIGALMGLAGFNGGATNTVPSPQPLNNINGVTNHNINNGGNGGVMMNMNGYNNHHAMNMQMLHHQQPQQMMYQRSTFVPATSNGYYYNYNPSPYGYYPYSPYQSSTIEQHHHTSSHLSAANMSTVEETSNNNSCNIM